MPERSLQTMLGELKELLGKQLEAVNLMDSEIGRIPAIKEYRKCQVRIDSLTAELECGVHLDEHTSAHEVGDAEQLEKMRYSPGDCLLASPSLCTRLVSLSTPVAMPKGAVLFRKDEPAFGTFLVREGTVSLRLEGEAGNVVIDRICGPGAVLGLPANLSKCRYSMTAIAVGPCELAFVSHKDLMHSLRNDPTTAINLLKVAGDEIINLHIILAAMPKAVAAGLA